MADMMWVTATTTLPEDVPIEVWQKDKFHEACCKAAGLPTREFDSFSDDEQDLYCIQEERLMALERFLDASEVELNDRTIKLAGEYGYGLTGFTDHIGFETTCQEFGMAFIASDDGGKYAKGTWTCWQPNDTPDGVNLTLPADHDNQPVVDRKVWKNLSKLPDHHLVRALRLIFSDTPNLAEYPAI